jgi:adenylyltransferase/sulfurtransferase
MISRTQIAIGKEFQNLKNKEVVIVGCGGTGCNVANIISRWPLKKITIIDCDIVEDTNLERQLLFNSKDLGKFKQEVAGEKLKEFNPSITIVSEFLTEKNQEKLNSDLVIDCTDNLKTRHTINNYCQENNTPWLFTASIGTYGQIYLQMPNTKKELTSSKNIMKLHEDKEDSFCSVEGISSPAVITTASLAANIILNYLTKGIIEKKLIRINFNTNEMLKLKL